ncbi:unnamed protein product [Notodromas monacha]|uniref:Uncharacterized protein n=1 Tax=Notodromas monacha TaxID=399045 RepID=A0A7R9GBJ3_9CRUS|nr:unnamed protein product [Notodromas monacha]CAG0916427.1 unnamed protein product [Notodromas monacha]
MRAARICPATSGVHWGIRKRLREHSAALPPPTPGPPGTSTSGSAVIRRKRVGASGCGSRILNRGVRSFRSDPASPPEMDQAKTIRAQRTKRKLIIFSTFMTSLLAMALLVSSAATDVWVTGTAISDNQLNVSMTSKLEADYGLFKGQMNVIINSYSQVHDLETFCSSEENVCFMGCSKYSNKDQETLLNALLYQEVVELRGSCRLKDPSEGGVYETEQRYNATAQREDSVQNKAKRTNRTFINYGLWISTMIFWAIAAFGTTICLGLALLNTITDPSTTFLSSYALYFSYPISAAGVFFTLVLGGAQFGTNISDNLMVPPTLSGEFSESSASVGYSYWCVPK